MTKKIMLVDDSETTREWVGGILTQAGFEVKVLSDRWISTDIHEFRPDLLLIDIRLAGGTLGTTAVGSLKGKAIMKGVKTMLYSYDKDIKRLAHECGADGWISKSVRDKDLIDQIKFLLDG